MKAIVLGCGLVGGVIAKDLARDENFQVTVADIKVFCWQKTSILKFLEAGEMFEIKLAEIAAQRATSKDIELIKKVLK